MSEHSRQRTKAELETEDDLRAMTAHLAEVMVATDAFGHVTFRVADKPFVFLGSDEGGVSISTKTAKEDQDRLIATGPYTKTPYIGRHGWVSFNLNDVDWVEVEERVLESYWRAAPRRLIRAHEKALIESEG